MITTIGYEGAALGDFLATLKAARVTTLLDIRELPISRRRGFAKTALATALEAAGIRYVHLAGLGDPKEGRDAARAGDTAKFLRVFKRHMKTKAAKDDLGRAAKYAQSEAVCLMCYERDPSGCHRKIVADSLVDLLKVEVRHLGVRDGIASEQQASEGARPHSRQGSATRRQSAR